MHDLWPNVGRFTLYSMGTAIAVILLSVLVQRTTGLKLGTGVNLLTVILPAVFLGMQYARAHKAQPEWRPLIQFAVIANLVVLAITLSFLTVAGAWAQLWPAVSVSPGWFSAMFVGLMLIYVLATVFFFRLGVRNQIKTGGKA